MWWHGANGSALRILRGKALKSLARGERAVYSTSCVRGCEPTRRDWRRGEQVTVPVDSSSQKKENVCTRCAHGPLSDCAQATHSVKIGGSWLFLLSPLHTLCTHPTPFFIIISLLHSQPTSIRYSLSAFSSLGILSASSTLPTHIASQRQVQTHHKRPLSFSTRLAVITQHDETANHKIETITDGGLLEQDFSRSHHWLSRTSFRHPFHCCKEFLALVR
jgi:hypothetical protein